MNLVKRKQEIESRLAEIRKASDTETDIEKVTGGVLDDDYIDYLTKVMFYAKRADKTLDQVLSDLRDRGCTQEALDYVVAHW